MIGWFRAGYPDEAPATGYSALLALNGPITLTPRQIEQILGSLASKPAGVADIEVAITKGHRSSTDRSTGPGRGPPTQPSDPRFPDSH